MAVEKIEEYRQLNGVDILKVYCTSASYFTEGYNFFYAPADAIGLVIRCNWFLRASGKNQVYVSASDYYNSLQFHVELYELNNKCKWQGVIDHINHVEIDNVYANLNAVTPSQNAFNKISRGYAINTQGKHACFKASVTIDGKKYYPFKASRKEDEVCKEQNYAEQVILKERLGNDWYTFNFFKYRRGSNDLLDLERTGQISEEEAVYRHILKYSENAWYVLRYGLEQYFKDYHIPIPWYILDSDGFMVHPITGQRLCPF